jgi:uncharacterized DUF497 family protein
MARTPIPSWDRLEFGWDPAKDEKTRRDRGFGFDYAVRIFLGRVVEAVDRRRTYGEERIRAIGQVSGRIYVVIYTDRPGERWIISAWKASGKDARTWRNSA